MKIYIAGQITGLDAAEAYELFLAAEVMLESHGHTPLNPMKLVEQGRGTSGEGRVKDPYMAELLDALRIVTADAEAVYFLPNWHGSWGATRELEFALKMQMPVYFAASELPLGCDWPEPKER